MATNRLSIGEKGDRAFFVDSVKVLSGSLCSKKALSPFSMMLDRRIGIVVI